MEQHARDSPRHIQARPQEAVECQESPANIIQQEDRDSISIAALQGVSLTSGNK